MPRSQPPASIATFVDDDDVASGLAEFAGAPSRPIPADFGAAQIRAGHAHSIVVAFGPACDARSVECAWAAPARDALAAGTLDSIELIGEDAGDAVVWRARRPKLWQRISGQFEVHDLRALLDAARQAR